MWRPRISGALRAVGVALAVAATAACAEDIPAEAAFQEAAANADAAGDDQGDVTQRADDAAAALDSGTSSPDGGAAAPDTVNPSSDAGAAAPDAITADAAESCKNGQPCDDGNACTKDDVCKNGTCVGDTAKQCDDSNTCTDDSCNPVSGECAYKSNDEKCSDENPCTVNDQCEAGKCKPGAAKECSGGTQCRHHSCDPTAAGKCVFSNKKTGTSCDDGDKCTSDGACAKGLCEAGAKLSCDDKKPCTVDSCDKATGCQNKPGNDLSSCDDGDKCTEKDACSAGVCSGLKVSCDDGKACTTDSCHKTKGCVHAPVADGKACEDGDKCTAKDVCKAGSCQGGAAKLCVDANACTADSCDGKTGNCVHPPVTKGKPCSLQGCTAGTCDGAGACKQQQAAKVESLVYNSAGFADGAATTAKLNGPRGVAVEKGSVVGTGLMYVADWGNHRIRQVGSDGVTTTLAGNGTTSMPYEGPATMNPAVPNPAGVVASGMYVYWSSSTRHYIGRYAKGASIGVEVMAGFPSKMGGYSNGTAKTSSFNAPMGLAFKSGSTNIYVADSGNNCIRLLLGGGVSSTVSTFAGSQVAGSKDGQLLSATFNKPSSLSFASNGDLFVVDSGNKKIRRVSNNAVTTLTLTKALVAPAALAVGPQDNIYIADSTYIRKLAKTSKVDSYGVWDLAGSGVQGASDGVGAQASFGSLAGIAVSGSGLLIVSDTSAQKSGLRVATLAKSGCDDNNPCTKDSCDSLSGKCKHEPIPNCGPGGGGVGSCSATTFKSGWSAEVLSSGLMKPFGVTVGSSGAAYVSDFGSHKIYAISPGQKTLSLLVGAGLAGYQDGNGAKAKFNQPAGLALFADTLYVADHGNHCIRKVDTTTKQVLTIAGFEKQPGTADGVGNKAKFNKPLHISLSVDGLKAYVIDSGSNALRQLTLQPKGGEANVMTIALNSFKPQQLRGVVTAQGSELLLSDSGSHDILRIFNLSTSALVAGVTGKSGVGDGPVGSALLSKPAGLLNLTAGDFCFTQGSSAVAGRVRCRWGNEIVTLAGCSSAGSCPHKGTGKDSALTLSLYMPEALAFDHKYKRMLVTDRGAGKLIALTPSVGAAACLSGN